MPAAVRRLDPAPEAFDPPPRVMPEAADPIAVAPEPAAREPAAPAKPADRRAGRDRRGPLRPGQLVSPRARLDGFAAVRGFRLADAVLVIGLALAVCAAAHPAGLLAAPLAAVLPYGLTATVLIWGLGEAGAYGFTAREGLSGHLLRTFAAFMPAVAALAAAELTLKTKMAAAAQGAAWLGLCFAVVYLAHVGWWSIVRRWRAQGLLTPNIVVVGATRNAEQLIAGLIRSREAHVLGVFDDRLARNPRDVHGVPVLGDNRALLSHRLTPFVDRIVLTVPSSAQGRVRQIIEQLRVLPNDIALFLDFDAEGSRSAISRLANAPLAQLSGAPRDVRRAFSKRMQDLVIGVLALIVALPVMALLALAIRLDSPGPVLFRQRRHGFNNEEIVVWKFRTMRHDVADQAAVRQVTAGDERVTRVGRLIRRSSLDELPQIFNVLKGEMSLVGPRPHAVGMKTGEVDSARLVAEYAHRHRLKPGMTGWAAVHGSRGPVDTPELVRRRVALDVDYIERQSLWLDLYIMAMTIPCLLGDRAAVR